MINELRATGIEVLGDVPWGTHFCQFYQTQEDLIEILVPYFRAGLENNEFCVWVTSEFLTTDEALQALQLGIPEFPDYLKKGQIEVFPHTEWYLKGGCFELKRVLGDWVVKHDWALANGFSGTRVSGNPFWIDNQKDWDDFAAYEAAINTVIHKYKLVVLCTYSLVKCHANEVIDVVGNHEFALIKRQGEWDNIESAAHRKMEQALVQAQQDWERTFASVPDAITLLDKNHRITRVNQAMANALGLTPEQCVGLICYEHVHGTSQPPDFCPHSRMLKTGLQQIQEVHTDHLGGDFLVSATPLRDNQGTLSGSVHVAHDITKHKQAEEQLIKLNRTLRALNNSSQAMIRASSEAALLQDVCRIVVEDCNHAMVWIGFAEINAEKSVRPVASAGFEEGYLETLNITWADTERSHGPTGTAIRTCKPSICHNMLTDPCFTPWREQALKRGYASSVVIPLLDSGKAFGAINIYSKQPVAFSVDEVKLLMELADDLAHGIISIRLRAARDLAEQELKSTLEDLKRSNADLEQFAYVASHDLQEPLRMVSSYVQMLAKRYQGKLDVEADEFIHYAVDGARRMQNLISDLLDYSRLGTRGQTFVQFETHTVLNQAISNLQMAIEASGAVITWDPLPKILGDPGQYVQLFQNLIDNAIKFRDVEPPRIHISAREQRDGWIFSVADNGIGIDPKHKDRIFLIFQRLHSDRKYPGTGIGLAVCKKIVERHGGKIWVESVPQKGITVYFTTSQTSAQMMESRND